MHRRTRIHTQMVLSYVCVFRERNGSIVICDRGQKVAGPSVGRDTILLYNGKGHAAVQL